MRDAQIFLVVVVVFGLMKFFLNISVTDAIVRRAGASTRRRRCVWMNARSCAMTSGMPAAATRRARCSWAGPSAVALKVNFIHFTFYNLYFSSIFLVKNRHSCTFKFLRLSIHYRLKIYIKNCTTVIIVITLFFRKFSKMTPSHHH